MALQKGDLLSRGTTWTVNWFASIIITLVCARTALDTGGNLLNADFPILLHLQLLANDEPTLLHTAFGCLRQSYKLLLCTYYAEKRNPHLTQRLPKRPHEERNKPSRRRPEKR